MSGDGHGAPEKGASMPVMNKENVACHRPRAVAIVSWMAASLVCAASLIGAKPARADTAETTDTGGSPGHGAVSYVASIRALAGVGAGDLGASERLEVAGEGWFGDHLGAGAFVGAASQGPLCLFCLQHTESTGTLGFIVAARTARKGSYALLTVGGGYVWATQLTRQTGLFGEQTMTEATRAGAVLNVCAAWLFHAGVLEIGPAVTVETTTWGSVTATANLALGVAVP